MSEYLQGAGSRCLSYFHENIRNQFVHFSPKGWSIEMSGMPEIATLIARIIDEILDIGWAFRHQKVAQREEMKRSLKDLSLRKWAV
jgi:hypothetical protein